MQTTDKSMSIIWEFQRTFRNFVTPTKFLGLHNTEMTVFQAPKCKVSSIYYSIEP